jgi:5-(carboxyamino)imidazole ribonucleotide synthase
MITKKKIGILGGGQLGKMLCEAASPWHLNMCVLDKDDEMSAAPYCTHFFKGNFKNYNDVLEFGKQMDIVTIEIEHVNIEALFELEKNGVEVHPKPEALVTIVDKGLQKSFYKDHDIPTSPFILFNSKTEILSAIEKGKIQLPFVQKTRTEGYDGRGVQLIRNEDDLERIVDVPSVIEELIHLDKELAVITSRNSEGQIETFDPVEMDFREGANLLDVLKSPAEITDKIIQQLRKTAEKIISELDIVGVLAIEYFLDKNGKIYVNEVAPRPHNSGHHTIENNIVSQYEQHIRAIMNLPLIQPQTFLPAVMINVLGEVGYKGKPILEGLEKLLKMRATYFHWYGKSETKPFRKMGHITFLSHNMERAMERAYHVKTFFKVKA